MPSGRDGFEGMGVTFNEHKDIKYFGFVLFLFADKNSTALLNAQALDDEGIQIIFPAIGANKARNLK